MTLMLPLESVAICSGQDPRRSFDRFCGVEKVAPPSLERLKKMSPKGQTTLMLSLESMAICWPWGPVPLVLFVMAV